MSVSGIDFNKNCSFVNTMVQMNESEKMSLFDRHVLTSFTAHNFDEPGYSIGQIMEPSVLVECAELTKIRCEDLENLNYESESILLSKLKWLFKNRNYLHEISRLNLASAFVAISRYNLALKVFSEINFEKLPDDCKVNLLMLKFAVDNRLNSDANANEFFLQIIEIFKTKVISDSQKLAAIGTAIVWYSKRKIITQDTLQRLTSFSQHAISKLEAQNNFKALTALSNYYRAQAMLEESPKEVRNAMDKCFFFAEKIDPKNEREKIVKTQLVKTCYESQIKEYLYIHRNFDEAERVAKALIELDPLWSISWAEMAEVYEKKGDFKSAKQAYFEALKLGAPRVPKHLYEYASACFELGELKEAEQALRIFLKFDPNNASAVESLELIQNSINERSPQQENSL